MGSEYNTTTPTQLDHSFGDIFTYKNWLTTLGGLTRKVEVHNGTDWSYTSIPPVGNYDHSIFQYFTTLVVNDALFVFGMFCVSCYVIA